MIAQRVPASWRRHTAPPAARTSGSGSVMRADVSLRPMSVEAGRRERTKAANRAAILEAARRVFGDLGYGAASVRDVIRGTDLAAGTFYNYFPDKEAVFRALLDEVGAEARRRVRE